MRNVLLLRTLALMLPRPSGRDSHGDGLRTVTMRNGEKLAGATITAVDEATGRRFPSQPTPRAGTGSTCRPAAIRSPRNTRVLPRSSGEV